MNLPKAIDSNSTSNIAVTYVQAIIEEHHWIFRRQDGITDFGIDAEIEVVDRNLVTGNLCKCQVKGSLKIDWKNDYSTVQVKVSTFNLWKKAQLPVIAFLVDVSSNAVYWSIPLQQHPREGAEAIAIRFAKENSLRDSFPAFRDFLGSWYSSFSKENILREVPYFDLIYTELKQMIHGGDPWCQIGEDDDFKTRLFYRHVLQLRSSLGLSNVEIPSVDSWYIRSAAIWNDYFQLFHAVFSELMLFIGPYYEEALQKLQDRLEFVEECFENQELINFYLQKKGGPDNVTYSFMDERFSDPNFHKEMENKLDRINALRYSYFSKK